MSFDEYDGPMESLSDTKIQECKPDYEAQAASLKKKLDATNELEVALFKFKNVVGVSSFRKISSFAEFVGGLFIKRSEFDIRYAELLKAIEKDK
jgi:hypothetical protein